MAIGLNDGRLPDPVLPHQDRQLRQLQPVGGQLGHRAERERPADLFHTRTQPHLPHRERTERRHLTEVRRWHRQHRADVRALSYPLSVTLLPLASV